jgi:nucleoside-diphosphate-sugar epimerase
LLLRKESDLRRVADILPQVSVVRQSLRADGGSLDSIVRAQPEVCVHAAWYAIPGKYLTSLENISWVQATLRLFEALAEARCRKFVGLGTCFEYDTDIGVLSENSPTRPRSLYAASKLALWLVLEQWSRVSGMKVAWARLFYQFGPFEDPRRLVPSVVLSLLQNRAVDITPGEQIRDFLHVDDVAAALAAIATSEITGPINVGSGAPVSVWDVVDRIGRLMNRSHLLHRGALPYATDDPKFVCADNRRLRESLGWRPVWTLDDGLKQTINWWTAASADV